MLMPGAVRDSAGRVQTTTGAGGSAGVVANSGIMVSTAGRVLCDSTAPAASAVFDAGVAQNAANGSLHVVGAAAGSDYFANGFRISALGQLVVAVEGTPVFFANGDGFLADGSLCTTEL